MTVKPNNSSYSNKAAQLRKRIEADIQQGRYPAGQLLPSELDLAERYQVSRTTIRRVLAWLVDDGQLIKQPQRGVVVPGATVETNNAAAWQIAWITTSLSGEAEEYGRGLQDALASTGFTLGLYCSQSDPAHFCQLLERLIAMRPGGMVLQCDEHSQLLPKHDQLAAALTASGIPLVRLDSEDRLPIICDRVAGVPHYIGQVGARYLVAKNYRDLTFLSMCPETDHVEYVAGLRYVLTPAGLALPDERVIRFRSLHGHGPAPDPFIDGEEKMRELLAGGFRRGTILSDHDYPAAGILRALLAAGVKVPEEVQVISLDRCHVNGAQPMRLTTIESHRDGKGYMAGRQLLKRIAGHAGPPEVRCLAADEMLPGETG